MVSVNPVALMPMVLMLDGSDAHWQTILGFSFANATQAACCFILC
jgi:hypothetical protein